jgi:hypothetical protein
MPYYCLDCEEVYCDEVKALTIKISSRLNNRYIPCPKNCCYGEIVFIDEMFLPVIKTLNHKNYFTEYCCSGHFSDFSGSYIKFSPKVLVLPSLPIGYKLENYDGVLVIRRLYDENLSENDYHKLLLSNAITTLDWAQSLPVREVEDEEEDI